MGETVSIHRMRLQLYKLPQDKVEGECGVACTPLRSLDLSVRK